MHAKQVYTIYAPLSNKDTKKKSDMELSNFFLDISLYQWDDELIKLQKIIQKKLEYKQGYK
jgi:hypothetical protein